MIVSTIPVTDLSRPPSTQYTDTTDGVVTFVLSTMAAQQRLAFDLQRQTMRAVAVAANIESGIGGGKRCYGGGGSSSGNDESSGSGKMMRAAEAAQ